MATPSSENTAAIFGSTGAIGSNILQTLLQQPDSVCARIHTISRRLPAVDSPKLSKTLETDTSKWAGWILTLSPQPSVIYNAVGTTRAAAGGIANQWKIDHDLCVENARAAKAAGVKTYVYISSAGTRGLFSKHVPYSQMKIGVEDAIRELGFDQAIIVRPGMILGERETPKAPFFENLVGSLHKISPALQDRIGQDQKIIARAAVAAARLAQEGKAPSKYWTLEQADVIKYGRDEWKE